MTAAQAAVFFNGVDNPIAIRQRKKALQNLLASGGSRGDRLASQPVAKLLHLWRKFA